MSLATDVDAVHYKAVLDAAIEGRRQKDRKLVSANESATAAFSQRVVLMTDGTSQTT